MARVARLAGALLVETEGRHFLVGNTKRPCDWNAAGFADPGLIDALARPHVPLQRVAPGVPGVAVPGPWLALPLEGEPLLQRLADLFVIERNGTVSDRLWRLVLQEDPESDEASIATTAGAVIEARWLGEVPPPIWRIVRDSVLKCL